MTKKVQRASIPPGRPEEPRAVRGCPPLPLERTERGQDTGRERKSPHTHTNTHKIGCCPPDFDLKRENHLINIDRPSFCWCHWRKEAYLSICAQHRSPSSADFAGEKRPICAQHRSPATICTTPDFARGKEKGYHLQ